MDRMIMHTPNQADENFRKLAALFPNAVTETIDPATGEVVRAIDKDILMQEISARVVEGREERYQFTWPDKRKAILAANAPIAATLRPVRADSVGRDGTPGGWDSQNLYIEGDNLDVLKLLQETYLGRVKIFLCFQPHVPLQAGHCQQGCRVRLYRRLQGLCLDKRRSGCAGSHRDGQEHHQQVRLQRMSGQGREQHVLLGQVQRC